jgi:type II secretory pathway component PulC
MQDYKLKLVLTVLSGIIFAFIFVLLAFVSPIKKEQQIVFKPKSTLEKISHSARGN